jgi:hypothetical protein
MPDGFIASALPLLGEPVSSALIADGLRELLAACRRAFRATLLAACRDVLEDGRTSLAVLRCLLSQLTLGRAAAVGAPIVGCQLTPLLFPKNQNDLKLSIPCCCYFVGVPCNVQRFCESECIYSCSFALVPCNVLCPYLSKQLLSLIFIVCYREFV